jgi:hypothetical protein
VWGLWDWGVGPWSNASKDQTLTNLVALEAAEDLTCRLEDLRLFGANIHDPLPSAIICYAR